MADVIVKMEGISKTFGGIKALNNVHLELQAGEVHALMGENGAGKSTLMKILTGVYSKEAGHVYLRNEETGSLDEVEMKSVLMGLQNGLCMVFQELNLLDNMTVAENIYLGREPIDGPYMLNRKELNDRAREQLKKVKLNVDPNMPLSGLSPAEKQCVEIAKALSFDSRVIIFDEPTSSLSASETKTLFSIINELKSQGRCIVYISHRMEEVFEICDRITVFRNGEYVDTKKAKETNEAGLIKLMIGRDLEGEPNQGSEFVNRNNVVLEVKNVKIFPDSKPVSLKLYEKEILGMFGLVGAGRTELSRIIFGIDGISEGEIYIKGKKVDIKSPKDAIDAGIGLVPEDRKGLGLVLGMSIKDNMLISKLRQLKSAFLKKEELKSITGTYTSDLSIKMGNENQEVKELSGGNQQKVVIAKWLAMEPDILIMDEPTRGIDVGAKSEIYDIMKKLAGQGKSIIMISSEMEEIQKVSDRVMVLHAGSVTGELDIKEANKNNIMQAAFGGVGNE
ncbi:MAG: sugar ABC transporter ATP-binding protein [Lachnospiraceae bacterium]|nr:sugar ABC transporter ATP-binding protein [Lachnospiraceae bacterium]